MSFANAYGNEIRMPAKYVDLSAKEMEYDGQGWFGAISAVIIPVAGALITGVAAVTIAAAISNPIGLAAVGSLVVIGAVTGYCALPI
ncbi:MAG: hypothetical protein LBM39_00245 [Candidatus Methanoplasma sp.]|nr:hypothetical protein [Candidatus Methanoplasma sp.]